MMEVDTDLKTDPRWQLIEKITASSSFQKSARLRDLLRFLAERSLHGQSQDLSEHRIGSAVFGKPQDYSVVEDSSVRVHVRQLRLKLHEYFDGEGRQETSVVEIPKGAYTTLFRSVEQRPAASPVLTVARHGLRSWLLDLPWALPWALAALFLTTTVAALLYHPAVPPRRRHPGHWPRSSIRETVPSRWW